VSFTFLLMGFHDKHESISGVPRWQKIEEHCSTTFWLFVLGAKWFTIINVVHFLKKRYIVAFSFRNLIFLTKFWVWTVSHFIFSWVGTGTTAWEKGLSEVSYECYSSVESTYLLHHFGCKWCFTRPYLLQSV